MNLRNVTIGTTLLLLIATTVFPVMLAVWIPFVWFLSSLPLVVTLVIACKVEHNGPNMILLGSTIVYATWYLFALFQTYFVDGWMLLGVVLAGIVMFPVMFPAWIAAIVLNRYYARQAEPQS